MKKIITTVIILLFLCLIPVMSAGCSTPSEETDPNALVIMSYNIKTVMVDAEANKTELSIHNRNPRILNKINTINPDVFGLQEAVPVHTEYLEEHILDTYDGVITYRSALGTLPLAEAASVYYKKDKFELIDSGTFWLSETPDVMSKGWDAGNYRICTFVKLKIKENGKIFYFYNTHLDFGAVSVPSSVELILSRMDFGYPCILVGDFNFTPETAYYQTIAEVMDDSRYVAEVTTEAGTTSSFKLEYSTKIIDHLFLTKSDFTVDSFAVSNDDIAKYGFYASDHFPVYAHINLIG